MGFPYLSSMERGIEMANRRAATRSNKLIQAWSSYLFLLPILLFIAIFVIFPLIYNMILSIQDVNLYNLKGDHHFVGLKNYNTIFNDEVFYIALQNSVIFTVLCIVFQFTIGFALALFFNQKFPGRSMYRSLMLLAWMLPMVITASVFQWIMSGDYGVLNYFLMQMGFIKEPVSWLSNTNTALYRQL